MYNEEGPEVSRTVVGAELSDTQKTSTISRYNHVAVSVISIFILFVSY